MLLMMISTQRARVMMMTMMISCKTAKEKKKKKEREKKENLNECNIWGGRREGEGPCVVLLRGDKQESQVR